MRLTPRLLAPMRLAIELSWLIPLWWMLGAGMSGRLASLLPIYLFLAFGLAAVVVWPYVAELLRRTRAGHTNLLGALFFTLVAALTVVAAYPILGIKVTVGLFLLNWLGLIAIVAASSRLQDEESGYEEVVADFRLGILCLVFALAFAFLVAGRNHVTFTAAAFAGVVAYVLFGVFCLAFSRSFAQDSASADERRSGVEIEWIVGMIVLLGGLALASLILSQLFAFDIVGGVGLVTAPLLREVQVALAAVIGAVVTPIFDFVYWLTALLGQHHGQPLNPKFHPTPGRKAPSQVKHHRPAKLNPTFVLAAKLAAILVVGSIAIVALAAVFRHLSVGRVRRLVGERRVSGWSWRKLVRWSLFRGRLGMASLVPHRAPKMRKPRRIRSVRDVYRALLVLGRDHAQPKTSPETGLEYGARLNERWPTSTAALDHLTALYMAERYGGHAVTSDAVRAAADDFREVENEARSASGNRDKPTD